MQLVVSDHRHDLTRLWAGALRAVLIRHPNPACEVRLTLEENGAEPSLVFEVLNIPDNQDESATFEAFKILNVRLTFFPGERLAHAWIAAAWGCFLQHEALELVTVGDFRTRVLDPHASRHLLDHMFHKGFPFALTPSTLVTALATAVPQADAEDMCRHLL